MKNDDAINLKLKGKSIEDLKIISSYLQDSIVQTKDIIFLERNRIFIIILNRFMWEDIEKGIFRKNRRIRCALKFEEVLEVKSKNINQKNKNKPLEYMAIKSNILSNNNFQIKIFFSGGGVITVVSEIIKVLINDLGKPWKVKYFPLHKI
jgi:hypothetical protein